MHVAQDLLELKKKKSETCVKYDSNMVSLLDSLLSSPKALAPKSHSLCKKITELHFAIIIFYLNNQENKE